MTKAPLTRSQIMQRVKAKSGLDGRVMEWLDRNGYRYVAYPFGVRGPDVFIVSSMKFVYLDGCFWHGCPKHFRYPKTNQGYWLPKIAKNISRDSLREKNSVRVWEHEVSPCGQPPGRVL